MSNRGQLASCRFFQGFRPSSLQVNPYIALSADGTFGNHLYLYVPVSTADSRGNFVINRDPGEMLCPIILASFWDQLVVNTFPPPGQDGEGTPSTDELTEGRSLLFFKSVNNWNLSPPKILDNASTIQTPEKLARALIKVIVQLMFRLIFTKTNNLYQRQ